MSTQKQIDANRANSLKSTGPNSLEGKNKTRFNALRDGITGQVITLSEEDLPLFEKLKDELIADLAPKTVMELKLANSIAWDTWRLDRLRAVEMNIYALGAANPDVEAYCDNPEFHTAIAGAVTFGKESSQFALLSVYEQRLNRNLHKNLATLREMQAERRRNFEEDIRVETRIARANEVSGLPYHAPARPSRNGFVFSTSDVLAAANRETIVHTARTTHIPTTKIQFAGAWDNFDPNRPNSGLTVAAAA